VNRAALALLALAACKEEPPTTVPDPPVKVPEACTAGADPELFLGRGVGGAFVPLEDGDSVGLSAAPQGGFGVSALVGSRGLQAGDGELVTAEVTGFSDAVETSLATFSLSAALQCKTDGPDGPQGIVYGVVIGFASSLSNSDLLLMNGQSADLTVTMTDAVGTVASIEQSVILIVGE
jgi:hypothetical protein